MTAPRRDALYPLSFSTRRRSDAAAIYLGNPSLQKLVEFFENKGLAAIKVEDQREQWYEDWIAYQAKLGLYASVLSPKKYSTRGSELDLLRLTRFLEVFAYFSPAHGYSLQVTFLGLFAILMGSNTALKQEAVAALERGELFAFGVSEKDHGSDLLANEFTVAGSGPGRSIANGRKYYIGNANCAAMICVLARKADDNPTHRARRALPILFALRPGQSSGLQNVRKISTFGIRAAFVGEFEVRDYELIDADVIAEGRGAWDAVLGTVTLGKFFLGFGSIGICERGLEEAIAHLSTRMLYGKPVIAMPHISARVAQAYARLTAMKLYAYRALDYVHAATEKDRRYLLFNAVQKARVSTEGVKVISLLGECIGAKGFESATYFEMALRDIRLIPGLEGSMHINLGLTAQFIPRYFNRAESNLPSPRSLAAGQVAPGENSFLMEARVGQVQTVTFARYLNAYKSLWSAPNVRIFARQAVAFRLFVKSFHADATAPQAATALGECLAIIAYGQLVAENAAIFDMPSQIVAAMFHLLIDDLSIAALSMASSDFVDAESRILIRRMIAIPRTTAEQWNFVLKRAGVVGTEAAGG